MARHSCGTENPNSWVQTETYFPWGFFFPSLTHTHSRVLSFFLFFCHRRGVGGDKTTKQNNLKATPPPPPPPLFSKVARKKIKQQPTKSIPTYPPPPPQGPSSRLPQLGAWHQTASSIPSRPTRRPSSVVSNSCPGRGAGPCGWGAVARPRSSHLSTDHPGCLKGTACPPKSAT